MQTTQLDENTQTKDEIMQVLDILWKIALLAACVSYVIKVW